jgi:WD40 repeat protein
VEYLDRSHGGLKGEGRAELYDLSTGKKLKAFEQKQAYDGPITAAAFSPDGRFAATGSSCGPIRLWEVKTGEQVRGFYGHLGKGPDISFIGDDLVQIDSWIGPLEHFDERQRQWLDRIRRQQELTVDVSQIPSFPWHHQHESP